MKCCGAAPKQTLTDPVEDGQLPVQIASEHNFQ